MESTKTASKKQVLGELMKSEINFRPWPQMPLTERVYLMFIFFLVAFFPFIYIMGLGPSLPKTPEIYTVTISPTPTPTPPLQDYKVFVSSARYNGNLGGLLGADAKCQALADNANPKLSGTFKAWLSDDTFDARDRIPDVQYSLVDGTIVANNKADLLDGSIQHAINVDENGTTPPFPDVWTGTLENGMGWSDRCDNWATSNSSVLAGHGSSGNTNGPWTVAGQYACNVPLHLYCFQIDSPVPPINHNPTILPIPEGYVGKNYSASVKAKDLDRDDLTMVITDLPAGLSQGNCSKPQPGQIVCRITGKPQFAGIYEITVEVTDEHGLNDSKTFDLEIL